MRLEERERVYHEQVEAPVDRRAEELEAEGESKGLEGAELFDFVRAGLEADGLYPFPPPPEPDGWDRFEARCHEVFEWLLFGWVGLLILLAILRRTGVITPSHGVWVAVFGLLVAIFAMLPLLSFVENHLVGDDRATLKSLITVVVSIVGIGLVCLFLIFGLRAVLDTPWYVGFALLAAFWVIAEWALRRQR